MRIFPYALFCLILPSFSHLSAEEGAEKKVDFAGQVKPILESACFHCHRPDKADGELSIADLASIVRGGEYGTALVVGKPEESPLYTTTVLPADHDDIMPPKGDTLSKEQTEVLRRWIAEGAGWPDGVELKETPRVDFVKNVQPIFETQCVSCHQPEEDEGDFIMTTKEAAFTSGDNGPSIIPFDPKGSYLYELMALDKDDDDIMPPTKSGTLTSSEIDIIRLWIAQGAVWPDGVELQAREKDIANKDTRDTLDLAEKIHALISETAAKEKILSEVEMKPYEGKVPLTGAPYHMVPIPGGEFMMGSPPDEKDREDHEGPQFKAKIAPFWMGKYEVTWDEYGPFMITAVGRNKDGSMTNPKPEDTIVDMVSQPTTPYTEMSFGMGTEGYPAICMTQHAANKYSQWLSAQTGHFYRLPTEAEWEYACRAGTTTAYSFGDDPAELGDYAWYFKNSKFKYQKVGEKKPNPWGLYDMHGNVLEWTLDQYIPEFYSLQSGKGVVVGPWARATQNYPHSARGGSWDDDPYALRSAARRGSDADWKQQDPQLPKSIWYHTEARWLGFRLVRPLKIPTPEEMFAYWNNGVEKD